MFRRKEDGSEEPMEANDNDTGAAGYTPTQTPGLKPAAGAVPANAPAAQPAPSFRPAPPQAAVAARPLPQAAADHRPAPSAAARSSSKRVLTVGPDIQMKGEIASCDRVVIEGMVDAVMKDVHTVELAETGSLKGVAEVEDAEISGAFEGDLNVRGKLTIYASGRVRGNVTYGEIEIQRGGQISGNIRNGAEAKANPQGNKAKAA